MRSHGIQAIANQTVRTLLHSTLRYHIKNLKVKYPDVDIILIQPEWNDERMFSHNPMYYNSRLVLAEHGFTTVTRGLIEHYDYYEQVLERHGIQPHTELVRHKLETLRKQPDSVEVLQKLLTLPTSEPDNGHAAEVAHGANDVNLRDSLLRLEQNLDRLDQLIGNRIDR